MDVQVGVMVGLLLIIADLSALAHISVNVSQPRARAIWSLIVILTPGLGLLAWLMFGPRGDTLTA